MARVKTLKFEIDGKEYVSHVNFSPKTSLFSISIDWRVIELIGLEYVSKRESKTLDELINPILELYEKYLDAQRTHELFIVIDYKCSGEFVYDQDGHALFDWQSSKFRHSNAHYESSALQFGFTTVCKQIDSNGIEAWYRVKLNTSDDTIYPWTVFVGESNEFHLDGAYHCKKETIIPYSEASYNTLLKAQDGIRSISQILIELLSQESEQISNMLNGGNVLKLK